MYTKTIVYRLLVADDTDPHALAEWIVGKHPIDAPVVKMVYGAAELDDDGIPMPDIPVRDDVQWDGWPVDYPDLKLVRDQRELPPHQTQANRPSARG